MLKCIGGKILIWLEKMICGSDDCLDIEDEQLRVSLNFLALVTGRWKPALGRWRRGADGGRRN